MQKLREMCEKYKCKECYRDFKLNELYSEDLCSVCLKYKVITTILIFLTLCYRTLTLSLQVISYILSIVIIISVSYFSVYNVLEIINSVTNVPDYQGLNRTTVLKEL